MHSHAELKLSPKLSLEFERSPNRHIEDDRYHVFWEGERTPLRIVVSPVTRCFVLVEPAGAGRARFHAPDHSLREAAARASRRLGDMEKHCGQLVKDILLAF